MRARLHPWPVCLALALGCTSPESGSTAAAGQDPAPVAAGPADPERSPADTQAPPLGDMLEQTVRLPALEVFWHADLPDRVPLHIITREWIRDRPSFRMHGAPVVYVDADEATRAGRPVFELTTVRVTATTATLEFRYDVEGVVGSTTFARHDGAWVMTTHEVAER
jgi:hypothetical protein